jgi:hypothetical protein
VYLIAQYKNQWRNFAKLGLRMMISDTKILSADDDEKVDLEEIAILKLAIKENLI